MTSRLATDAEVTTWQEDGWVLLEGLVGTDDIDAASDDLRLLFPSPEEYHADPEGVTEQWKGRPAPPKEDYVWPDEGPGFRADQQRWMGVFPFAGSGALNRLYVHDSIVNFAERTLETADIRLYQAHASAKFSGLTNYEQPLHIDRNHSWLPPGHESPWWNVEGFLYLSDVTEAANPTRMVSRRDSAHVTSPFGVVLPDWDPGLYAAERPAPGVRGSYLAYRSDVYHRGAPFGSPGTTRGSWRPWPSRTPESTGSATTSSSRVRPVPTGRGSWRARRRASWSFSGSPLRDIRSGTKRSSSRRRSGTRRWTSALGGRGSSPRASVTDGDPDGTPGAMTGSVVVFHLAAEKVPDRCQKPVKPLKGPPTTWLAHVITNTCVLAL